MWGRITPLTLQAAIESLLATHPPFRESEVCQPIRPFLEAKIVTPAEEVRAKTEDCEAWDILTQPAPPGVDRVAENARVMNVLREFQV